MLAALLLPDMARAQMDLNVLNGTTVEVTSGQNLNQLFVQGGGTYHVLNNGLSVIETSATVFGAFGGGDILIDLGGEMRLAGGAFLRIDPIARFTIGGTLTGGDGANMIFVDGTFNITEPITFDLGAGDDTLAITGVFAASTLEPFDVQLGAGDDVLRFTGAPTFGISGQAARFRGGEDGETAGDTWLLNGTTDGQYDAADFVLGFEHLVKEGSNTWTLGTAGGSASVEDVSVVTGRLVLVGDWEITGNTTTVMASTTLDIGDGTTVTVVNEAGDADIAGTLNVTDNATFNVAGTTTVFSGAQIIVDADGTLNAAAVDIQASGEVVVSGAMTATDTAVAGVLSIGGSYTASGLTTVFSGGEITVDAGGMLNSAAVDVQTGGTVTVSGTMTASGLTTVFSGGEITVDAGGMLNAAAVDIQASGEVVVSGTMTATDTSVGGVLSIGGSYSASGLTTVFSGGEIAIDAGGMLNAAAVDIQTGGLVTVSGTMTATDTSVAGVLDVESGGTATAAGLATVFSGGEITVDAGGTLNAAAVDIQAGGLVTVSGTMTATGLTTVFSGGEVTVDAGGTLNATAVDIQAGGLVVVSGDMSATDTNVAGVLSIFGPSGGYTASGLTTVQAGGLINVGSDAMLTAAAVDIQSGGLITVSGDMSATDTSVAGSLSVFGPNGSYTASGTTTVQAGGAIGVGTGGTMIAAAVDIRVGGAVVVFGTMSATDTSVPGFLLVQAGGTMAAAAVDIQATGLVAVSGDMSATDTNVAGLLFVVGGSYAASGVTTVLAGGLIDVETGSTFTAATVAIQAGGEVALFGAMTATDATVAGFLDLAGGSYTASGVTTVLAGGLIDVDTGGTMTAAAVDIQAGGEVAVSGAVTATGTTVTGFLNVAGGSYTASGPTTVLAGGLIGVDSGGTMTAATVDIQGGGVAVVDGTMTATDTIVAGSLSVNGTGSYDASGATTVMGNGEIVLNGGTYTAQDTTTLNDTSGIRVFLGGIYTAQGAVLVQDNGFIIVDGDLFDAQDTTTLNNAGVILINAGTYQAQGATTLNDTSSIQVNVGGTYTAQGATTLNGNSFIEILGGTYQAQGAVLVQGAGIIVDGGLFDAQDTTTVAGDGLIAVTGGTYQAQGATTLSDTATLFVFDIGVYTAGAPITVNGGTVMGTGTIDGGSALNNVGGTVAPGASIGTLSLVGTYSQGPGGSFEAEVAPGAAADLLAVTGTAQLAGTIDVVFVAPGAAPGQQHVILATDAPIDGIFDTASLSGPDTENVVVWVGRVDAAGQPDVTGSDVALLILAPVGFDTQPETPNQRAVADYLGNLPFAPGGTIVIEDDSVFGTGMGFGVLGPTALDQIGGEVYDAFTAFSFDIARQYGGLVDQRVRTLRCAAAGGPGGGGGASAFCGGGMSLLARATPGRALLAPSQRADAGAGLAPGAPGTAAPRGFAPQTHPYGWSVWASGLGSYLSKARTSTNLGYSGWTGGGAIGVDLALSERWIVGVLAGGATSDIGFSGVPGDGDLDAVTVGAYTAWYGRRWFADAAFTYTHSWVEADRPLTFQAPTVTAKGKTEGDQYAAHATLGYGFKLGRFSLEATGGIDYVHLRQYGFTETGAGPFNLTVDTRSDDSLRLRIGVRVARAWRLRPNLIVAPSVRVGYARELLDNTRPITASLPNIAGSFTVHGDEGGRDILTYGAGLQADFSQGITLYVAYAGEWATDRTVNTLTGGLRIRW